MNTEGEEMVECETVPVASLALLLIPSWGIKSR